MLFMVFIIYLFGVIGLSLFKGMIYYSCRATPQPLPNATHWEFAVTPMDVLICNPNDN